MVHEEQPVGIVFCFHGKQSLIVVSPKGLLPRFVEVIAFGNVRAWHGHYFPKLGGRFVDRAGMLVGNTLVEGLPRYAQRPSVGDDG